MNNRDEIGKQDGRTSTGVSPFFIFRGLKGLEVQNVPQIPDTPPFNPLTIIKNSINVATGIVQPLMEGISKITDIPQLSTVGGAMEYGITKLS